MALFDCKIQATSGHARALSYETAHGTFQTPMFMPVGTSATVKGVTAGQLRDLDSQVVLANTYHLSLSLIHISLRLMQPLNLRLPGFRGQTACTTGRSPLLPKAMLPEGLLLSERRI